MEYPLQDRVYKHYKGGLYKVISLALDANTKEEMVIYCSTLFGTTYVRPLKEWDEDVDVKVSIPDFSTNKYKEVDGKDKRFKLVKN